MRTMLIVVDVQNDFMDNERAGLPVKGSNEIINSINETLMNHSYDLVVGTQDWHPSCHCSFASTWGKKPFIDTQEMTDGSIQLLWPNHCIKNTCGSEFHPDLLTEFFDIIIRKGTSALVDSYSAFFDNGVIQRRKGSLKEHRTPTYLHTILKDDKWDVDVCGIATDVCVKATALDALLYAQKVTVLMDKSAGTSEQNVDKAIDEMTAKGVNIK